MVGSVLTWGAGGSQVQVLSPRPFNTVIERLFVTIYNEGSLGAICDVVESGKPPFSGRHADGIVGWLRSGGERALSFIH